jgi:hypothetical protein
MIEAFSPAQLQRLEWQAILWAAATGELQQQVPAYLGLPPLPQPELSLPPPVSPAQLVTLKLLPVQASRITSTDSLMKLRAASCAVSDACAMPQNNVSC